MRLTLWFIFLILVLANLRFVEGLDGIAGSGRWYTISHATKPSYNEMSRTIKCNYDKNPPKNKMNECISSAFSGAPVGTVLFHPGSLPHDNNVVRSRSYYLTDPQLISGTAETENRWILYRTDSNISTKILIPPPEIIPDTMVA
jgi:hypothetical protein